MCARTGVAHFKVGVNFTSENWQLVRKGIIEIVAAGDNSGDDDDSKTCEYKNDDDEGDFDEKV